MKGENLLPSFRERLVREEKSPRTVEQYVRAAGRFVSFLAGREPRREHVLAYKEQSGTALPAVELQRRAHSREPVPVFFGEGAVPGAAVPRAAEQLPQRAAGTEPRRLRQAAGSRLPPGRCKALPAHADAVRHGPARERAPLRHGGKPARRVGARAEQGQNCAPCRSPPRCGGSCAATAGNGAFPPGPCSSRSTATRSTAPTSGA